MTYLPRALYLAPDDMVKFVLAIPATGWTWKPVGITWHNTGAPTLAQWDNEYSQAVRDAWGDNYDHYCKFDEGWHAGPHAVGAPDKSIVLGEFRANGVHASCWNSDHFGIETIGDFRHGIDDPLTGRGLASMQGSANIIAALCKRMGWDPRKVINFHRGCKRDGHPCPGDLVTDEWAIGLVEGRLAIINGSAQGVQGTPPAATASAPAVPDLSTVEGVQRALVALGADIAIDGIDGPETDWYIRTFQKEKGLVINGVADSLTQAALAKALGG